MKNKEPHVLFFYRDSLITRYFRLKIINKGKTVAKNCRVKIISIFPKPEEKFFEPDTLKWASAPKDGRYYNNSQPIYKENKDITPRGGWEFCDLFMINSKGSEIVFISSGKRKFLMRERSYIVTIEICGDNLKPKKAKFKISNFEDFFKRRIDLV